MCVQGASDSLPHPSPGCEVEASVCSDRILTFGIRSIRSPAKVGIGYYKAVKLPAQ